MPDAYEPDFPLPARTITEPGSLQPPAGSVLARAAAPHEHNCDLTTEEGKEALMRTAGKPDFDWDHMPDFKMPVVHWRVHEVSDREEENGEMSKGYRMVLVFDDGRSFATGSPSAISVLALAVDTYGREPWNPPIMFTAKKGKTRSGQPFCLLECHGRFTSKPPKK